MKIKPYKLIFLGVLLVAPFASCSCSSGGGSSSPTLVPTTPDVSDSSVSTTPAVVVPKPTALANVSDLNKVVIYSLNNTYLVRSNSSIKDGSTEVYRVERTINVEDTQTKSGSVLTYYYELDEDFKLTRRTDVKQFKNLDIDTLLGINLNESYLKDISISTSSVTYKVNAANAKDYYKNDDVTSDTDVAVSMTISDFKITNITTSYSLNGKTISSETTYSYLA